jgi:multicomponent Na+:H+ antiporter subunit E
LLFLTWLVWSGHYTALLLALGGISCLLVVALCRRMAIIDPEGHPNHLLLGALSYTPWILWQIIKANLDVAWRIVQPKMPISPRIIRIKSSQKTHLGQVIYANSITLTPGTVAVEVEEGEITVHALTREAAEELLAGTMDRRVTRFEDER